MQIDTTPVTLSLAHAQVPPVLADISNVTMFAFSARKRKHQDPTAIADAEVANAALLEHRLIAQFTGTAHAPPWFATFEGALTLRLDGIEQRIEQRLVGIEQRMVGIEQRLFNGSALDVGDAIHPPQRGDNPAPANFPVTVQALRDLQVGPLLTEIENYYALNHGGAKAARKNRIRRVYGIGVITTQGGPHILEF
jgi:hypothetical protein